MNDFVRSLHPITQHVELTPVRGMSSRLLRLRSRVDIPNQTKKIGILVSLS